MKHFKTISRVFVAAGMMVIAVACSKGSDSSVSPYGYYGQSCPTCVYGGGGVAGGPLLSNVQFSTGSGGLQGLVNLGGSGTGLSPYSYQGPVSPYQVSPYGNGVLVVNSNSYCVMPGQYSIVQASGGYQGSGSYGILNGLVIQAQGPGGQIMIQASSAQMNFSQNRLEIGIGQLITNGQSCGSIATY